MTSNLLCLGVFFALCYSPAKVESSLRSSRSTLQCKATFESEDGGTIATIDYQPKDQASCDINFYADPTPVKEPKATPYTLTGLQHGESEIDEAQWPRVMQCLGSFFRWTAVFIPAIPNYKALTIDQADINLALEAIGQSKFVPRGSVIRRTMQQISHFRHSEKLEMGADTRSVKGSLNEDTGGNARIFVAHGVDRYWLDVVYNTHRNPVLRAGSLVGGLKDTGDERKVVLVTDVRKVVGGRLLPISNAKVWQAFVKKVVLASPLDNRDRVYFFSTSPEECFEEKRREWLLKDANDWWTGRPIQSRIDETEMSEIVDADIKSPKSAPRPMITRPNSLLSSNIPMTQL